jgi:hypothetical protein
MSCYSNVISTVNSLTLEGNENFKHEVKDITME